MEQHHLALLFDTFTDRVGDRKFCSKYETGLLVNTTGFFRLVYVLRVKSSVTKPR